MVDANAAFTGLYRELAGEAPGPVRFTGADPVLPGRFLVGTAAAACVGATTLAAARLQSHCEYPVTLWGRALQSSR